MIKIETWHLRMIALELETKAAMILGELLMINGINENILTAMETYETDGIGDLELASLLDMSEERLKKLYTDELVTKEEYLKIVKVTGIPEERLLKKPYDWTRRPKTSFVGSKEEEERAMEIANKLINFWENLQ